MFRVSGSIQPNVQISQKSEDVLRQIQSFFGFGKIYKLQTEIWVWSLTNLKEIEQFLSRVLPYLIVKKRQAEKTLTFVRLRMKTLASAKTRHPDYTPEELQCVYDFYVESGRCNSDSFGIICDKLRKANVPVTKSDYYTTQF